MIMGFFGKKKPPMPPRPVMPIRRPMGQMQQRSGAGSAPSGLTEKIRSMSRQGMAEPEIVRKLRMDGYPSLEIDRAIRDSLKAGIGEPELPVRERPVSELRPANRLPTEEMRMPEIPSRYEPAPMHHPQPTHGTAPPHGLPPRPVSRPFPTIGFGKPANRETEELIEVTVEEKWKEAQEKIKGVENKFAEFEERIKGLEAVIEELKKGEQQKDVEISTKIDTYKESMGEMAEKMEGMESALKTSLESVLDSNRTLAEAIRHLKEKGKD